MTPKVPSPNIPFRPDGGSRANGESYIATPPKRARPRGVRMRKSFDDKYALTTVVISPREFKGSPAMLACALGIGGPEPIRVSSS